MTNQDMALVQALEKSIDYFYIGHQCRDDISDWKEDLQEERYSYLLTQVLLEKNPSHNDVQTLNKLMYVEGYVEKMYDLALHYYQAAVDVLKPVGQNSLDRSRNREHSRYPGSKSYRREFSYG